VIVPAPGDAPTLAYQILDRAECEPSLPTMVDAWRHVPGVPAAMLCVDDTVTLLFAPPSLITRRVSTISVEPAAGVKLSDVSDAVADVPVMLLTAPANAGVPTLTGQVAIGTLISAAPMAISYVSPAVYGFAVIVPEPR